MSAIVLAFFLASAIPPHVFPKLTGIWAVNLAKSDMGESSLRYADPRDGPKHGDLGDHG